MSKSNRISSSGSSSKMFPISVAFLILLVSTVEGSIRFRRDAAEVTTSPTEPSTTEAMTTVSSHSGHNSSCDVDPSSLKEHCPDNETCPTEPIIIEQCCLCNNFCCSMVNASEKPNKDFGGKVKDAISSAEEWIKSQGKNIKNQWDKAKESIKHTASDVKDKVKKGVDSITNRFKNNTGNASTENIACKGGNCSTAIPTGGNADSDSNESNGKGESDSDESGTPAPMSKKSRRDVYQARYSSAGGRDLDNSNSDEYAWSKTITRTIDRDNVRRFKRDKSTANMTNTATNKDSNTNSASSKTSTSGTTEKSTRSKRDTGRNSDMKTSTISSTTQNQTEETSSNSHKNGRMSRETRPSNGSDSGSLPAVRTSTPTTVTEGTMSENGRSSSSRTSSRASSSSHSHSRTRRDNKAVNKNANNTKTEASNLSSASENTTATGKMTSNEETYEEESQEDPYHSHRGKSKSNDKNDGLSISSISVHLLGPSATKDGVGGRSSKVFRSERKSSFEDGSARYPIFSPRAIQHGHSTPIRMTSYESSDEDVDIPMDHPPVMVYPDGSRGGILRESESSHSYPYSMNNGRGESDWNNSSYSNYHSPNYFHGNSNRSSSSGYDPYGFSGYTSQMGNLGETEMTRSGGTLNPIHSDSFSRNVDGYVKHLMSSSESSMLPSTSALFHPYGIASGYGHRHSYRREREPGPIVYENEPYHHQPRTRPSPYLEPLPLPYLNDSSTPNVSSIVNFPLTMMKTPTNEFNSNTSYGGSVDFNSYDRAVNDDDSDTNTNMTFHTDSSRSPINFGKPGGCPAVTTGGNNCIVLKPNTNETWNCSYDDDCPGTKVCCFNTCAPYQQVGLCNDPVSY